MEEIALGELRLRLDYFYSLTSREFSNALSGFRKAKESDYKDNWERTRQIMWSAIMPGQKKNSGLTPRKLMPLPWDESDAPELQGETSPEAIQAVQERWMELDSRRAEKEAVGSIKKTIVNKSEIK